MGDSVPRPNQNRIVLIISSSYKHSPEEYIPDEYIECTEVDIIGDSVRYVVHDMPTGNYITNATRRWQSVKWYRK